jgi:hypothetical protein
VDADIGIWRDCGGDGDGLVSDKGFLKKEKIMSWSLSAEVTKEDAVEQIMKLEPTSEISDGAKYQLIKAKEYACDVIAGDVVRGEKFGVSLAGHSQSDSPGSASDTITVSIYARN